MSDCLNEELGEGDEELGCKTVPLLYCVQVGEPVPLLGMLNPRAIRSDVFLCGKICWQRIDTTDMKFWEPYWQPLSWQLFDNGPYVPIMF